MNGLIGIRREHKNKWERRVPLIPEHIRELEEEKSIHAIVEPSEIRIFTDEEYRQAGANVQKDLSPSPIVLGIKEMPIDFFEERKTYVFFSHVIKGQKHNMPLLKRMLELKCQLIDYEKITDEKGARLIFFGRYAGHAGMMDSFWALGQRLEWEGISSPFSDIKGMIHYESLEKAEKAVSKISNKIEEEGLPDSMTPFICGFAGYGNVSKGAQEIFDLLPFQEISPDSLHSFIQKGEFSSKSIYKVVFKEEHMVEPISPKINFQLQDYYDHPERYRSAFERYVPHLTALMNCIYWDKQYPRLVTKNYLKKLFGGETKPRLRVIGDISCDVEGAIEATLHTTDPGNPIFVYDPFEDKAIDGYEGNGPVILAVDNLPCEIARESSLYFSSVLKGFIPDIVKADYSVDFEHCVLPPEIKKAVIVYQGMLTPNFQYLNDFL